MKSSVSRLVLSIGSSSGVAFLALYAGGGCSTQAIFPGAPPAPTPPAYVQVPHPAGTDMGDLRAIFFDASAPKPEKLKGCDADFKQLYRVTESVDERKEGVHELVLHDPVAYHWCFYSKLLSLEDTIRNSSYADVREKATLDTFWFAVPVARAFLTEYHDSRYLRWAIEDYRHVSRWVFFRPLELTPQETQELVDVPSPFGLWRDSSSATSVLEKYHLANVEPSPLPSAAASASPAVPVAAAASPEASVEPSTAPQPLPPPVAELEARAPASAPSPPEPLPSAAPSNGL